MVIGIKCHESQLLIYIGMLTLQ